MLPFFQCGLYPYAPTYWVKLITLKDIVSIKATEDIFKSESSESLAWVISLFLLLYIQSSVHSIFLTASFRHWKTYYSRLSWVVISVSLQGFFPHPTRKQKTGCAFKGRKVALNILIEELRDFFFLLFFKGIIFLKIFQICAFVKRLFSSLFLSLEVKLLLTT